MKKFYILSKKGEAVLGVEVRSQKNFYNVTEPKEISRKNYRNSDAILLDYSEPFYFSRDSFARAPKEVLLYQIKEKIQPLSIFSRSPYVVYKVLDESLSEVDLAYLAIDSQQFRRNLEFFLSNGVYVFGQYHFVISIASLSLALSSDPVLSLYITDNFFLVFITDGSDIIYIRHFPAEEYSSINRSQVEAGVLSTMDYYHRFSDKHIEAYIAYGPRRNLAPALGGLIPLEVFWPNIKGVDADILLTYPEYYGTLFVSSDFNLLPEDHKVCINNLGIARKVALSVLILSFLNYGLWYHFSNKSKELLNAIRQKESYISSQLNLLSENMPRNIHNFQKILQLSQNFSKQFRVDYFLSWMAQTFPKGVEILEVKIGKSNLSVNSKNKNTSNQVFIYSPKLIQIKAKMEGSAKKTQDNFYYIFNLLNRQFVIQDGRMEYVADQHKAIFYFSLLPKEG